MHFKWLILIGAVVVAATEDEAGEDKSKNFPKKLLARRREEHLVLLKNIALNPKYEWRFKLVEVGVTKVFELINENRVKLKGEEDKLSEARVIVIENACLLMDFIVNFKEDIYKIFHKVTKKNPSTDWKVMLQVAFDFLKQEKDLLDELTTKELEFILDNWKRLMSEEILPDYPYENNIKRDINIAERIYQEENDMLKAAKKKDKKKLKKGPALRGLEL